MAKPIKIKYPRRRTKKLKEPYIVAIDKADDALFELVSWHQTEEEAIKFYEEDLKGEYPDRAGRNKHLFKMVRTTGEDLG